MKNILLTFLILTVFSCQDKKKEISSKISITKEQKIEKKNEVVISVNDTISSFFTNLFVDEMQDKPDMLYLGQKENKTSVTIPTQNTIKIIGGDPFISFFYELQLEKGDSLIIGNENIVINQSKQIEYPIFTILNNDKTWSETNFDYLLYNYNLKSKAIVIDENKFQNNKYNLEKIYKNSIVLLDSLKSNNSVSDNFYSTTKVNQRIKFVTSKIRQAKNQNLELEIENLGLKLNEEELLDNEEYVSFLRALILYKYFREDKRVKKGIIYKSTLEVKVTNTEKSSGIF